MTIQNVLARLDRVVPSGKDRWRAPCPVHNGKDRNLMISERSDGSVGAHCFVCGATGPQLCDALGLPLKEIFAPDSEYVRQPYSAKMREQELEDSMVLTIAESDQKSGKRLSWEDKKRIRLAKARLEGINSLKSA